MICPTCPPALAREVAEGFVICEPCAQALGKDIFEAVDRYLALDASPSGGGAFDGGRRAPGFGSKPPGSVHIMALADDRTVAHELGQLHSAKRMLQDWALFLRAERGQELVLGTTVITHATHLVANLDYISRQDWVLDLHAQLKVVLSQLRPVTGGSNPKIVGPCPECGADLFLPRPGVTLITCEGCGHTLDPLAQINLKAES